MLYAATLHLLAGALTGAIFKVRTLLVLLGLVAIEAAFVALSRGSSFGLMALLNIGVLQVGYFLGMFARAGLEHMHVLGVDVRPRRQPE